MNDASVLLTPCTALIDNCMLLIVLVPRREGMPLTIAIIHLKLNAHHILTLLHIHFALTHFRRISETGTVSRNGDFLVCLQIVFSTLTIDENGIT